MNTNPKIQTLGEHFINALGTLWRSSVRWQRVDDSLAPKPKYSARRSTTSKQHFGDAVDADDEPPLLAETSESDADRGDIGRYFDAILNWTSSN